VRTLIAGFGLALALSSTALAAGPAQFDLVCTGKDDGGQASAEHVSVDIDKKAWCLREEGKCDIATLFGIEGDTVIFERSQLETGAYDHWVNRKSGEYRNMSSTALPPITSESKGTCKEVPFTSFGVALNDAAKAARN
jgi:hypothetical protein